jgi:hypothetical protein
MPSVLPDFEYDIFLSYRQKDNKGDRWVSDFVAALKDELDSTFKEEISVYFDINPLNGILETHDVDASLKDKLKCLIFIPILSRTYCDTNSFAWTHEFKAFVELAGNDKFGLKVLLPNNNFANRVLPIRIHDLDKDDIKLCESIIGGVFRGIDFVYKSAGVNRPLRAKEDNPHDNLNHTNYRDQINKVALAIKDLIESMKMPVFTGQIEDEEFHVYQIAEKKDLYVEELNDKESDISERKIKIDQISYGDIEEPKLWRLKNFVYILIVIISVFITLFFLLNNGYIVI